MDKNLKELYAEWEQVNQPKPGKAVAPIMEGYRRAKAMRILSELSERQREALKLYEPLKQLAGFHKSDAAERIVRGSNRAGKTIIAAVEAARIVTNQDPHNKYPDGGKLIVVGKDGRHISDPLYKLLFKPGAIKIIKDDKGWRSFRPWSKKDKKRENEAIPAPPLIPPRFYDFDKVAWESKKENWPKYVTFNTGWELQFCTGQGKPPQGIKANVAWFDEEIPDEDWYNEIALRLVDDWGLFFWSATAQLGGVQLYELCERAKEQETRKKPSVVEFFGHINDNKHFTDEQRNRVFAKLTDEQIRIRIEGEFAFANQRIYPEFSPDLHGVPWFDIPRDWTRYAAVDPGRQVAAAIFCAIPPPSWHDPDEVYFYDEIYLQAASAKSFAEKFKQHQGTQEFQSFIIDHRGGRIRDMSKGLMVEDQYSMEFRNQGISSRTTGCSFIWGSDDLESGIEKLRSWLLIRSNGQPKLRYFPDKLPYFRWQMDRYHYKRDGNRPSDKPIHKSVDLPDCARYLAMFDPQWKRPTKKNAASAGVARAARKLAARIRNKGKKEGIVLGPVS